MSKKTTGIVAGVAGAALLMGGATFALWSDSSEVDGGAITTGTLSVEAGETTWRDVSDDRVEAHAIDLSDFRIVPGDKIEGTVTLNAALRGENMVAELLLADLPSLVGGSSTPLLLELAKGATVEITAGTQQVLPQMRLTEAAGKTVLFASVDNGHNDGLPTLSESGDDIEVVLSIPFPADIDEQHLTGVFAELEDFDVTLKQVRADDADGRGGYKG